MTAYTFTLTLTISQEVAARKAARKQVIEKARQLERKSFVALTRRKRQLQATNDLATIAQLINTDELLEKINKRFDTLEQGQAHTNTALEALEAGQDDLRKNMATKQDIAEVRQEMATKADVLNVGVKIDKVRKRIEGIEEYEGIPHPDKN